LTGDWRDLIEDAAHYPGGHASGVVFPRDIGEVAQAVASAASVLAIGAQSSLTGGATPMGELIVATSRMTDVVGISKDRITVQPGITVASMQEQLAGIGAWFPPGPTFTGACAGGIVATNAAGAATFKYGSTRDWVEALALVLADGTILRIERGEHRAVDGRFQLLTRSGLVHIPVPTYRMPDVAKRSAGYHAAPGMDLIDLFIGSEGTLGVICEITFRVITPAPRIAFAFVLCSNERQVIDLAANLRAESMRTWQSGDPHGIDVAALEHMDRRSLEILREDGADRRHNIGLGPDVELALLVQLELPFQFESEHAFDEIQSALACDAPDSPLGRFCRALDRAGLLANAELALPGDRRASDFIAIREAVPAGVNHRVGLAKATIDGRIQKTAADMIVPFDRFEEMMAVYRAGFGTRGLDYAVWGHVSDGNVHPNLIPRSFNDVVRGQEAILEFGREVARLGGCPLAEHGVGRNPVKQILLKQLYGDAGIEEMRAVKRALDPEWKLAPGVIFSK
jgi:D-lactate dehydrogenase (cytochrome)